MTIFPENEVTKPKTKKKKYTYEQALEDMFYFLPENWCKDDTFEMTMEDWVTHRMAKKPYETVVAVKKFVNKLIKLSKNDLQVAIMMIDYAIEKGWDTVWECNVGQQNKTYKVVKSACNKYDKFDMGE